MKGRNNRMAAAIANNVDLSVKSENVEYVRYAKGTLNDKTNKTDWEVKVIQSPSQQVDADLTAKGYVKQASQTIIISTAGTPDGFEQLVSDPEERVNVFNRGVMQKLTQKIGAKLSETTEDGSPAFQFSEEAFDPTEWLNEETKRRNLSPEEKAIRDLEKSGLPKATIENMIAAMRANQ